MKNFYAELEPILFAKSAEEKISLFYPFYENFLAKKYSFINEATQKEHINPTYIDFLKVIKPGTQAKRNKLDTDEGKAYFIHSILHIEYSAIDLALDHAYRFRDHPYEYYADWLEVAEDEIRHYQMLEKLLHSIGYKYGDFEVHNALFEAQQSTKTLRERMAVVPRYLEANGLDANVKMMQKLQGVGDDKSKEVIKALEIILQEEIEHVKKGDKWFLYACALDGVDRSVYFEDVANAMPHALYPKSFINAQARRLAGFSDEEIEKIKNGNFI